MSKTGIRQKVISAGVIFFFTLQIMFSPLAVNAATSTDVPILESSSLVKRLSGIDRYETAVKIAQEGWKSTSEYAVIAAGLDNNLVDVLGAVPIAKLKKAPLLLTQAEGLNTYTETELKRLEVKTVYVVTGNGVLSQNIFEKLAEMGIKVISLGGKDRFETSVNIAQELGIPTKVILTTASTNADALSIAPIAAAQGIPILLSDKDKLADSVASFLKNNEGSVRASYVIGGQGVISDSVKNALPKPIRVGGADRYETNLEILKTFADSISYGNTFIANGDDEHLVDALAGAPLAASTASPLLLSSQQLSDSTREFAKLNLSPNLIVLGGESALPDVIIDQLTSADIISQEGYVEGSKDVSKPKELKGSFKIIADNVVVENLTTPYSILIQGNNTKLKNVKVGGTVFIDPGENGTATLDNVTAGKIVVLSGATKSIHLLDVIAEMLRIASSTNVRVETSGVTDISNTVVSSDAILDVADGSVGTVEIYNVINGEPFTIELRGTYAEPVLVSSGANVIAGASSNISSLEIAPENSNQTITLEGTFNKVEVNGIAIINLSPNVLLNDLITNAMAYIDVLSGARIVNYDDKGNQGIITGTGAEDVFSPAPSSSDGDDGTSVNAITSIPLGFTPADQLMDPTQPVIYLTDKTNKKVYAVNYETKQISSLDFDLPPERLAYENNELYVTLLKGNHEYWTETPLAGAIAIVDTDTFTLADRFDIDTDPFDLVVRNGYIYVIPGSNQWEPISSYSRLTKLKVATSTPDIRFQSFAELNPVSDTIVTVDTDSSPRDMFLVNISNGTVIGAITDSPYHGDYSMETNFGVSLDGKYVFNGSGEVFDATNLNHVKKLNDAFYDIAFNPVNNNFYTADKLNNTITEYAYDTTNTFVPIATYHTDGPVSHLFYQNNRLIAVVGNSIIQIPLSL